MKTYKITIGDSYNKPREMTFTYYFGDDEVEWEYTTDVYDAAEKYIFKDGDFDWNDIFEMFTGEKPTEKDQKVLNEMKDYDDLYSVAKCLSDAGYENYGDGTPIKVEDIIDDVVETLIDDDDFVDYAKDYYEDDAKDDFNEHYEGPDDTDEWLSKVSHYW